MNQNIAVSIVIPSYNTSEMLKKMVNSIVAQTYKNWELLVIDDGSKDNTLEMMSSFTDPRIKTIPRDRQPKGGQTCRNTGLERSVGEYIIFFDSDDLISPNCLQQRVDYLDKHPELDFAVFPAVTFSDENRIDTSKSSYGINKGIDTLTAVLTTNYQYTVWTNIYRRDALLKAGIIWDEKVKVYQDFDFNLAVALASLKYDFAPNAEPDYYYRIDYSKNSVCSNVLSEEKNESTCYLFKKTLDLLSKRNDYDSRRIELYQFAQKHIERLVVGGSARLLDNYLQVLSSYYPEQHYKKFHSLMLEASKVSSEHKRSIKYWKNRVFILHEHKYFKHFIKVLLNR